MFFRNWEDQIKNTPLNEIIIRTPFSLFKLYDAYRKNEFYKDYVTKNGYMIFHLLSNDLIDKVYPDSKNKELAQQEIEKLSKENGSRYILFDSQNKIIELPIPLGQGHYAEVINNRWIRDRRKDQSEVILDSEKNFKEIIKSDPNYVIQKPEDNIIIYKSNGRYIFFNLATETILGEFDDYDRQWDPDTGYRGNNYIVKKDGKAGFASLENGVLTTNFEFEDVKNRMGYKDGYTYYLDKNNKPLYKVKGIYDFIQQTDTDKFIVRDKKGSALVTSDGKILIPFSSDYLYKKVNDYYVRNTPNTFTIFDKNGNQLSFYDIREPQLMNIRNFNQLDKILQTIPAKDLHKIFSLSDWAQIIAYSKDPEKTVELTKAGDVIAKFDDEIIKDTLKRTPKGNKKVAVLKIFKQYNNSPILDKYYKKYNIDEIKIKQPPGLLVYTIEHAIDPGKYPGMFSGNISYKGIKLTDRSISDLCCSKTYQSIGPNILVTLKPEIFEKIKNELPQQLVVGPPAGMLNRFSYNLSGEYFTRLTKEYFTIEDPKNLLKDIDGLQEIKINKPSSLDFDTGKIHRCKAIIDTDVFKADYTLELVDLGPYYTFMPYGDQPFIILIPKDQVVKDKFYPFIGSLSKRDLNVLKDIYDKGNVIYNEPSR